MVYLNLAHFPNKMLFILLFGEFCRFAGESKQGPGCRQGKSTCDERQQFEIIYTILYEYSIDKFDCLKKVYMIFK